MAHVAERRLLGSRIVVVFLAILVAGRAVAQTPSPAQRNTADGALAPPTGAPGWLPLDSAQRANVSEWYLRGEGGCVLYVREFGVGDTVVVLHGGWGAEHSYLLTPFRGLERHYHLVFYDQRGSLRSPCPDSAISVTAHVQDLERLRQQLGIDRLVLAGHSMGSWLAMKYLETHPDHVRGLVLLNALIPRVGPDDVELYSAEQKAFREWADDTTRLAAAVRAAHLDRPLDSLSDRERTQLWRIQFAKANIFRIDRWRQLQGGQVFYNQSAGSAAGKSMNANAGWDFLDDLTAFKGPVAVVIGDHDLVGFGGALHRRQLGPLPNVSLTILDNAGHNGWIDRPLAYHAALEAALAKATDQAASGGHRP